MLTWSPEQKHFSVEKRGLLSTPAGNPFLSLCQVEVERRPWLYKSEYGQQVGGFVKEFANIAFVTVKVKLVSDIS